MSERPVPPEELLEHAAFVRNLAHRLVRDPGQADDAIQETWRTAVQKPPRDAERARSWLGRVLRNAVKQRFRADGRRRGREEVHARHRHDRQRHAPSTHDMAARQEMARRMIDLVGALPTPYRDVLLLRFYEDLPPRKIAARLEIPTETVRTRIRRGLARLRQSMDEAHEGSRDAWMAGLLPFLPRGPAVSLPWIGGAAALLVGGLVILGWMRGAPEPGPANAPPSPVLTPPADGATLAGRVAPTRRVTGRIRTRGTGAPVVRAQVHVTPLDGALRTATSDLEGRWHVTVAASARLFVIDVEAEGHRPRSLTWTHGAQATVGDILLDPWRQLACRVVNPQGAPVVGAVVTALPEDAVQGTPPRWMDMESVLFQTPAPWAQATTDAEGLARFPASVAPGPWILQARHAGHAATRERVFWTGEVLAGGPITLALGAGRPLQGVLRDARGAPVAGAALRILPGFAPPWTRGLPEHLVTDAEGRFEAREQARGAPSVVAWRDGQGATLLFRLAAERHDVTLTLPERVAETLTVHDASGQTLGGADVASATEWTTPEGHPAVQVVHAPTDDAGRLAWRRAVGQTSVLWVHDPDRGEHRWPGPATSAPVVRGLDETGQRTGEAWHVTLREAPRMRLTVVDGDGRPLPSTRVAIHDPRPFAPPVPMAQGRTDALGHFVVPFAMDRPLRVVATAPAHRATRILTPPDRPGWHDVPLVLAPAAEARIEVVDGAGGPVVGAHVTVSPGGSSAWSDAEGRVYLTGLPTGVPLQVEAALRGRAPGRMPAWTPRPDNDTPVVIRLPTPNPLRLRAFRDDGRPVEIRGVLRLGTRQQAMHGLSPLRAMGSAANEGAWVLDHALPEDDALLVVAEGRVPRWLDRSAIPSDATTHDVVLHAGRTVTGHVRDAEGRPVAGAWVQVLPDPTGAPAMKALLRLPPPVQSDAAGHFRIPLVPTDLGDLQVHALTDRRQGEAHLAGDGPVSIVVADMERRPPEDGR